MYAQRQDEGLGLAIAPIIGGISSIFGGGGTGESVYREDGARWSAAKQYWELPPGTKAAIQSPKPSGSGVQSMRGGPVTSYSSPPQSSSYEPTQPTSYPFPSVGGPVVAGLSTGPLLIAGAAALGILFLSKRGRR